MARAKSVKPEDKAAPKIDAQQITIDKAEFVRTRDALITSWVTLQNALKTATSAYIDHSNAVLGGTASLDPSQLDLGRFLQAGELVTVGGGAEVKGEEKKKKRKVTPKDPNAPRRPLTAYLLWLGENREKIHADLGPEQKRGQISSEGTKRWTALPDSVKQKYKDAYLASREVYKKEMEEYTANGAAAAAASPDNDEDEADAEDEPGEAAQAPAAAGAESDASVSSDDDSSSDEDEPAPPPKEPTPPPVKTPRSALKGGRKKAEKAAPPASSPPLPASSPTKKDGFTTVNGGAKRKTKADAETAAEEPKKKRGRKVKEEEAPPVSTPAEAKNVKEKKKRGRKSQGAEA